MDYSWSQFCDAEEAEKFILKYIEKINYKKNFKRTILKVVKG
jgi:hypothetical protein